jgi:hypothetical protein
MAELSISRIETGKKRAKNIVPKNLNSRNSLLVFVKIYGYQYEGLKK